jgi:hypothetical protein
MYFILIELAYEFVLFPSFSFYSFLEFKPVEMSLNSFSVELEFKSSSPDGILFYASSINYNELQGGAFNYLAIILRNFQIEIRFFKAYF